MKTETCIKIEKALISLTKDGHFCIRIDEDADVELEDIKKIQEIKQKLLGKSPNTVIFVAPAYGHISAEARAYSASREVNRNAIAKAIVAKNLASRLITSFFIKLCKPPVPTQMFSTEKEATDWLNEMRTEFERLNKR